MEPMTLGSPGSPSTSAAHLSFLPGYLMGEQSPHSPRIPGSPSKTARQISYPPQNITTSRQIAANSPPREKLTRPSSVKGSMSKEKAPGPPLVSLFDTLETTTVETPKRNLNISTFTPSSNNNEQSNEPDCWVTVFGFPVSATPIIVTHFSKMGQVLEHNYNGKGNWVNLRYSSRLEAQRALAFNGRIIDGNMMIGVIPFKDNHALKDITNSGAVCVSPKSPHPISRRLNTSSSPYITTPPSRMRPLIGRSPGDVDVLGSHNNPAKNTSFVSKTMDYFFGW